MDYGEVLSKSWKIVWKHKVLWIFGILAGCARGGGGGGSPGGGGGGGTGTSNGTAPFGPNFTTPNPQFFNNIEQWINANQGLLVAAIVLFVLLVILLVLIRLALGTIGEIGLIRGVFEADGGAEKLGFSELFKESLHYFWRVLGLSLLTALAILIVVFLFVGCAILAAVPTFGLGALIILPLLCILFPIAVVATIVVQMADVAMVTEDLGLQTGVRRGWELFKKELGPILVIWLITLALALIGELVIAIPILVVVIPAVLALVLNSGNFSWTPLIIAGACFVAYLPVLLVAGGILLAYIQSVWTLTYLRLTRSKAVDPTAPALPSNA